MRRMMTGVALALVMACGGKRGPSPASPEPPVSPAPTAAPASPALPAAPASAAVASPRSPGARALSSGDPAKDLAEVHLFALGGVGFAGVTSRGEGLTLALSREPGAIEAFTRLGRQAAPAARLYAYWALRTLAPDRAAALAKRLRQTRGSVERMTGCLMYEATVAETIAELERLDAARAMPRP